MKEETHDDEHKCIYPSCMDKECEAMVGDEHHCTYPSCMDADLTGDKNTRWKIEEEEKMKEKKPQDFVRLIWINKANQQHESVFQRHKAERMARKIKKSVQEVRIEEL